MNNIPWPSFPSIKDTQDTLTKKVERLCILWTGAGGTEATANV